MHGLFEYHYGPDGYLKELYERDPKTGHRKRLKLLPAEAQTLPGSSNW